MFRRIIDTDHSKSTFIIRLMVGVVFLSEGIQKFLLPEKLGAGRFAKIGFRDPDFFGPFVGSFEIICGALVLVGLFTRLAAFPLLCIMLVAVFTTKTTLLAGEGFWGMMHAARTDWCMRLGSIFLLIRGGGAWSGDGKFRWSQFNQPS